MRPNLSVTLLGWLCAAADSVRGHSTVSVFLPEYEESDWAALRGSVISSDKSVTTYTVFCAEQAPSCRIAGDIPFIFTEGAHTLVYRGTDPGVLTAEFDCQLKEKTAATCTGSSSIGVSHRDGPLTGPTETVWTKTLTADDVTWGILTLSTPGPGSGSGPAATTPSGGNSLLAPATETSTATSGSGRILGEGERSLLAASLGALSVILWLA
ncbi:uncharacterized protein C8A04DRAFT_12422 [Dichotomopilus funicola]|uniref:Uncharacterized protein n=1 Tax=Dichotomopilus funicola TaxID=1934379 RepID=A0AAN6ZL73_9PEZI|nr:hypothetical protein C8A04DRAFT_12422 [Dichotomopilus funicola]